VVLSSKTWSLVSGCICSMMASVIQPSPAPSSTIVEAVSKWTGLSKSRMRWLELLATEPMVLRSLMAVMKKSVLGAIGYD